MRCLSGLVICAALGLAPVMALGEARHIDVAQSKLTVFVYRGGFFAFAGDNHQIDAPVASGELVIDPLSSVSLTIQTANMTVVDPQSAADKRAQVQARMLGPDVLGAGTYPTITFTSTSIQAAAAGGWDATGALTIHGATRTINLHVTETNGHYHGSTTLKQTDFGIRPVTIAGGAVKVKDEIKIDFDIVTQ